MTYPESRPTVLAWVQEHFGDLKAKLPDFVLTRLVASVGTICEAPARADAARFFVAALKGTDAGDRALREALETADLCIESQGARGGADQEEAQKGLIRAPVAKKCPAETSFDTVSAERCLCGAARSGRRSFCWWRRLFTVGVPRTSISSPRAPAVPRARASTGAHMGGGRRQWWLRRGVRLRPAGSTCETVSCEAHQCKTATKSQGSACLNGGAQGVCNGWSVCRVQCAERLSRAPTCQANTCTSHKCGTKNVNSDMNCCGRPAPLFGRHVHRLHPRRDGSAPATARRRPIAPPSRA